MSWGFPDFGGSPFLSSLGLSVRWPVNLLTVNVLQLSALNARLSMMAVDGEQETDGGDDGVGFEDGDNNSEPPPTSPQSDDPLRKEPMEHYQSEKVRADDTSRINRATGILDDLTRNDRMCPADESTALGPNEERSREVKRFLQSLQDESRKQEEPKMCLETDLDQHKASGERISPWDQMDSKAWDDPNTWLVATVRRSGLPGTQEYSDEYASYKSGSGQSSEYHECVASCKVTRGYGEQVAVAITHAKAFYSAVKEAGVEPSVEAATKVITRIREDLVPGSMGVVVGKTNGLRCQDGCRVFDKRK